MSPGTVPQNITNDLNTLATAVQTLSTDSAATATAQTSLTTAQTALTAAQSQQSTDQTAVQTALTTLQTDLQAWVNGGAAPAALKASLSKHAAKLKAGGAFDPASWQQLLQDLVAAVPSLAPVIADITNILSTL